MGKTKKVKVGRPKEPPSKQFSVRLKIPEYDKLMALGGKEWLLKALASA